MLTWLRHAPDSATGGIACVAGGELTLAALDCPIGGAVHDNEREFTCLRLPAFPATSTRRGGLTMSCDAAAGHT